MTRIQALVVTTSLSRVLAIRVRPQAYRAYQDASRECCFTLQDPVYVVFDLMKFVQVFVELKRNSFS